MRFSTKALITTVAFIGISVAVMDTALPASSVASAATLHVSTYEQLVRGFRSSKQQGKTTHRFTVYATRKVGHGLLSQAVGAAYPGARVRVTHRTSNSVSILFMHRSHVGLDVTTHKGTIKVRKLSKRFSESSKH